MVRPGINLIVIAFALFKIGAVPVIMDPGMGVKNFLSCIQKTNIDALIGVPLAHRLSRIFFPYFKNVHTRVVVRSGGFSREIKKRGLFRDFPLAQTKRNELAAILYTSGSTGAPKGVCYEHGMFDSQIRMIRDFYGIQPGEVDMPMLPIFALFNPALGMTTVIPKMNPSKPAQVKPELIVQSILDNNITNTFGSPAIWHKITEYCAKNEIKLPSIRRILMAGAPVSDALMERTQDLLPGGVVYSPYGATEALPVTSIEAVARKLAKRQGLVGKGTCVGKALPGMEIRIIRVSDDLIQGLSDDLILPKGEVGEIIVRGPTVTREYYHLAQETAFAKIKDGQTFWHRMGDIGYLDKNDNLWFCGRRVERVVNGDKTYYTDCCESIFNQHEHVYRSALIGLGPSEQATPAIVIEPHPQFYPQNREEETAFKRALLDLAKQNEVTQDIDQLFFYKSFPVDVRHNAKIHRLTLAHHFNKKLKPINV